MLTEELSELYIGSGRLREAQNDAEEALRKNPNDISAHRLLAHIFTRQIGDAQQNRVDEVMLHKSIEQYQKITELDPKDVDSLVMLGRLQKVAQNSVEAQKAYKKALELDPENEDALTGLALVYQDLGDTTSAADLLKKLAEKNPTPSSLRALAGAYEQMKEYSLAAQALQRALEMNPPDASRSEAADGPVSDAGQAVRRRRSKTYQDLVDGRAERRAARILRCRRSIARMKDFAKARKMSDKAKSIEPDNLEIRYNEVGILEAEGKSSEAIDALKRSCWTAPRSGPTTRKRRASGSNCWNGWRSCISAVRPDAAGRRCLRQMADLDPSLAPQADRARLSTPTGRQGIHEGAAGSRCGGQEMAGRSRGSLTSRTLVFWPTWAK